MTNQMFAWGPAALWAVVLFLLSSIPGSAIGGISVSDLFIHTCVYSVLGAALVYGRWKGSVGWPHGLLIAAGVLYGASDEWHQSFVPGRYPAVSDFTYLIDDLNYLGELEKIDKKIIFYLLDILEKFK